MNISSHHVIFMALCLIACGQVLQSQEMSPFEKNRQDLSFKISRAVSFSPVAVKPEMNYIQLRDIDPFKFRSLNAAGQKAANGVAMEIKKFLDAYAPGGTPLSAEAVTAFDKKMSEYRKRTDNEAIRDMAVEVGVLLLALPKGE